MKIHFSLFARPAFAGSLLALAVSCAAEREQLAENLAGKHVYASGFAAFTRISAADPAGGDAVPTLKTFLIDGRFQTIVKDANLLFYDRRSSAAWYNSSSVTTVESLTLSLGPGGDMAEALTQAAILLRGDASASKPVSDNKKD